MARLTRCRNRSKTGEFRLSLKCLIRQANGWLGGAGDAVRIEDRTGLHRAMVLGLAPSCLVHYAVAPKASEGFVIVVYDEKGQVRSSAGA